LVVHDAAGCPVTTSPETIVVLSSTTIGGGNTVAWTICEPST
jgi:hypothetical protein